MPKEKCQIPGCNNEVAYTVEFGLRVCDKHADDYEVPMSIKNRDELGIIPNAQM